MENDVFRVSLDRDLVSISQVALLTNLFAGCSVRCPLLWLSSGHPEGERLGLRNLQKKLEESSAVRKEADEKLAELQANLDQELAAL